jgi:hypothetical protein
MLTTSMAHASPPIAGFWIRVDLALEFFDHGLGLRHPPIQCRLRRNDPVPAFARTRTPS